MEFVPTTLKARILDSVIQGWIQFLSLSMGVVPALAKDRRIKFAGVDYIVLAPNSLEIGELARNLFMYMPIATARMATSHVGTEKLRVQLENGIGDDLSNTSASQQFMRAAILSQLGVDRLSEILEMASEFMREKRYLNSVFIRMLSEVVIRFRLPESELTKIKKIAANSIAGLEGRTGRNAASRKAEIIEMLSSNRRKVNLGGSSR